LIFCFFFIKEKEWKPHERIRAVAIPCEISIFDIGGKLVYSQILSKEGLTFSILLTELKSGIYFYQIRTENNELLKRDKIILIR